MIFKTIKTNKSIKLYVLGVKVFSHKRNLCNYKKNNINVDKNIKVSISINGDDNIVTIKKQKMCNHLNILIHGCRNQIIIEENSCIASLDINIGNHFPINDSIVIIGYQRCILRKMWFGQRDTSLVALVRMKK